MTPELLEKQIESAVSSGEDDIRPFINEIRQYPLLTAEQERELARRCAEGDEDAIRRMVSSNLRLVVSVAREYAGRGVPLLDLIQEGSIGLIAAARKFDYTLDFRFSTYATKWIRHGVTRYLADHSQMIRVPAHTADKIRKVEQARNALRQEMETEPTVEQIAARCGFDAERVLQLLQLNPETCSLDAPAGEEADGTLAVLLEDIHATKPQEEMVRKELENTLNTLLGSLNERQQQVLRLHFGMADGVDHSLEEIGKMLGISKERVRQIRQQAMEKLQKMGASLGLEEYLHE